MDPAIWDQINDLRHLKTAALRAKYRETFGVETRSSNKQFLFRRVAWRLQARAEGDLSERARHRAAEIADDADIRLRPPRNFASAVGVDSRPDTRPPRRQRDWRLPAAGSVVTRQYLGRLIVVQVCQDGFEYEGRYYRSLSAIARETGTRWNGLAFFHLTGEHHG
jgi:hypothetical protein